MYDVKIEYDLISNRGMVYYRGDMICDLHLDENNVKNVKEGVGKRDKFLANYGKVREEGPVEEKAEGEIGGNNATSIN